MKTHKKIESHEGKVVSLCLIISIAIFIIDSYIPLGVAGGVPYILVVFLSLWSSRKRLPYYLAIGVSILTIIGYFTSPHGGELWKVLFNRSLALFAIWTTAILSVQRKNIQEEKEKVFSELKILSGLLPICMSCKNIRNDKGYWGQIESYIRDHSEAEFTHGICPGCAEKLYSDLDLYNDEKIQNKKDSSDSDLDSAVAEPE